MAIVAATTLMAAGMSVELANILGGQTTLPKASAMIGLGMPAEQAALLTEAEAAALPLKASLIGMGMTPELAQYLGSDPT